MARKSLIPFWLIGLTLSVLSQSSPTPPRGYTIPQIDLATETSRQTVVDREVGQYLGHPTTVLLEDNRTIIAVYPKGHGKGAILLKRSTDGGKTWSARLPTPESWTTSLETPTIHRVIDPQGRKRLILFSGLYPIRSSISTDDGRTWSELKPIGDYGGIVTMGFVEKVQLGRSGELGESQETVLDLLLTDERGRNVGSTERAVLLRGLVFDEYNPVTRAWVRSRTLGPLPRSHRPRRDRSCSTNNPARSRRRDDERRSDSENGA